MNGAGEVSKVNLYKVEPESAAQWAHLESSLPPPALQDGRLSPNVQNAYLQRLGEERAFNGLVDMMGRDLADSPDARGYVLVALPSWQHHDLRLPTAVCSLAGHPFKLVNRWPLWHELGVDLAAEPHRFGGVGHNPFHIDLVNASHPPAFVCLLGIRTDPLGGGHTVVANLQQAAEDLEPELRTYLEEPVFEEGRFFDLVGVGRELRPFPVITEMRGELARIRFTAKMIPAIQSGPHRLALQELEAALRERQERFLLQPGYLLIVNNLIMAHGREALGTPQQRVPESERRHLRQTYLHRRP